MTSLRITIPANRRAAAQYVTKVRRSLQKAFADRPDVTQTSIAEALGVNRSVINRQLRGDQDMTLGRVAEIAWALDLEAGFDLIAPQHVKGSNVPPALPSAPTVTIVSSGTSKAISPALKPFKTIEVVG